MSGNLTWVAIEEPILKEKKSGLVALLHDLYQSSPEAKRFLNARYGATKNRAQRMAAYKRVIKQQFVFHGDIPPDANFYAVNKAIQDYQLSSHDEEGVCELFVIAIEAAATYIDGYNVQGPYFFAEVMNFVQLAIDQFENHPQFYSKFVRRLQKARENVVEMSMDVADLLDDLALMMERH